MEFSIEASYPSQSNVSRLAAGPLLQEWFGNMKPAVSNSTYYKYDHSLFIFSTVVLSGEGVLLIILGFYCTVVMTLQSCLSCLRLTFLIMNGYHTRAHL